MQRRAGEDAEALAARVGGEPAVEGVDDAILGMADRTLDGGAELDSLSQREGQGEGNAYAGSSQA